MADKFNELTFLSKVNINDLRVEGGWKTYDGKSVTRSDNDNQVTDQSASFTLEKDTCYLLEVILIEEQGYTFSIDTKWICTKILSQQSSDQWIYYPINLYKVWDLSQSLNYTEEKGCIRFYWKDVEYEGTAIDCDVIIFNSSDNLSVRVLKMPFSTNETNSN